MHGAPVWLDRMAFFGGRQTILSGPNALPISLRTSTDGKLTNGLDFAAFLADRKTVYAVVRALEIISQAWRRLPADLLPRNPHIDWPSIAAAGNIYRHEYAA